MTNKSQTNFNAGEISPRLEVRSNLAKFENACKTMLNAYSFQHGGVTRRPGFRYIASTKTASKKVRLIPFEFSTTQTYMLEFGESYMRVFKDQGQVSSSDANTKLLIHCDGNDAATTFTDEILPHIITSNNDTQTVTGIAEANFGQCADFDSFTLRSLSIPDHADFQFDGGSGADYTLDFKVRFSGTLSAKQTFWCQQDLTSGEFVLFYIDFTLDHIRFAHDNTSVVTFDLAGAISTVDEWYHIAVVRGWDCVTN